MDSKSLKFRVVLCRIRFFLIFRLNSEDFSKFFVGLDIIIWPYYYERTPREIQKNVEFFRIFSNFHEFFWFLSGFSLKVFLYSEIQLRATHHKNLHEILRGINILRPRGTTGKNWKNLLESGYLQFTGVEICVGSVKIK